MLTTDKKAGNSRVSSTYVSTPGDSNAVDRRCTPSAYFRIKGPIGRFLAAILLIPGIPIICLTCLIVRLTSRGPGIYAQVRVGKNGRHFRMYKIRTMRRDAEARHGPEWTKKDDPRITFVGGILRKLHLDELPQLFNVLRGEMTLIGPRPERPEFTQVLARAIPGYLNRLKVAPGITGLAQINLPPDTELDSVRRKLVLDLEYIETASPLLDLRMFISTWLRILGLRGEFAMRLMKLERDVPLPRRPGPSEPSGDSSGAQTPSLLMAAAALQNGNNAMANGETSKRSASNGSASNGSASNGSASNGSASNGSASNGSARHLRIAEARRGADDHSVPR